MKFSFAITPTNIFHFDISLFQLFYTEWNNIAFRSSEIKF